MDYIRIFLFYVVLCILSFVLERLFFFDTANLLRFPSSLKKSIIFSSCLLRQSPVFATHPNHSFSIRRNPLCIEPVGLVEKYPVFKVYGSMKKYNKKRLRIGGMGSLFLVLLLLRQRGV